MLLAITLYLLKGVREAATAATVAATATAAAVTVTSSATSHLGLLLLGKVGASEPVPPTTTAATLSKQRPL